MKTNKTQYKSVSDISVLQMTVKLAVLAGLFLGTSICLILVARGIASMFN